MFINDEKNIQMNIWVISRIDDTKTSGNQHEVSYDIKTA